MRPKSLLFFVLLTHIMLLLLNFTIASEYYDGEFGYQHDSSLAHTYTRSADIENHCSSLLSLASDSLHPLAASDYNLQEMLSFFNGEWEQESGSKYRLLPFEGSDMPGNNSPLYAPLKLVNFRVTDVNPVSRWKNAVSLIGVLSIGITRYIRFGYNLKQMFHVNPGLSVLSILFEGVYARTKQGETLMCMLGSSTVPVRKVNEHESYFMYKGSNYLVPLLEDDKILLLLRYPKKFSLRTRAIQGEMTSLNDEANTKFFDKVSINSNLDHLNEYPYQFNSEVLKSATCNPAAYPTYYEEMREDGTHKFNAASFCGNLRSLSDRVFKIEPDWRSKDRYVYRGNFGPFVLRKEVRGLNWSYDYVGLIIQNIICEPETNQENRNAGARVAAVIRAIPMPFPYKLAVWKTGLSNMTMAVEGSWNPSTGQLCMVGCLGEGDSASYACDSEVSLYFPQEFSIKQRSAIVGSIHRVSGSSDSYIPITFGAVLNPKLLKSREYRKYASSYLSYKYSKIDLAIAFRGREEQSMFRNILKQYLFKYPSLEEHNEESGEKEMVGFANSVELPELDGDNDGSSSVTNVGEHSSVSGNQEEAAAAVSSSGEGGSDVGKKAGRKFLYMSLGKLSRHLKFETSAVLTIPLSNQTKYLSAKLDLLSLGPLFAVKPRFFKENSVMLSPLPENFRYQLINVSMHLTLSKRYYLTNGMPNYKMSEFFLEGVYDQLVGHMYLIGCRKIHIEGSDFERGLDCLIEVKVEYAPVTARWFKNPTATIRIISQRNQDDPLFFQPSYLQTGVIPYKIHPHDVIFRKKFEGILRNLVLLLAIALILCQLFYMKKKGNAIRNISLVMLGLQILGYSLPLITGSDILLKWKQSKSFSPHIFHYFGKPSKFLDYIPKVLVFVALSLTAKLFEMVITSRKRLHARKSSTKAKHSPGEKPILIIMLVVFCLGPLVLFIVNAVLFQPKEGTDERTNEMQNVPVQQLLITQVEDYINLAQDLFLLPQMIGNFWWHTKGKPLSKFYYIGYTIIRLLLRIYDCVRDPVVEPKSEEADSIHSNEQFLSTSGNITVALSMIVVATIVYIQQSSVYQKKLGALKWMPFFVKRE